MKAGPVCLCLSLSLACFLTAAPVMARAQSAETPTYRSGLKSIAIPPPSAELSEVGSDYRVLFETMVPDSNRLIAAYLLSDDAANLRAGIAKNPSRYAFVETLRRGEFAEIDAASFKQIAATLVKQFGADQDGPLSDAKTKQELQDELNHKLKAVGVPNEVTLDKPIKLGAFFSRPDAYCFGMIAPITGGGSSIKVVTAMTTLRVQNRLLYSYVYATYTGEDSVQWVRETSEQWVDAILKANR